MTNVIELAKQAGCPEGFIGSLILEQTHVAWIERFAKLVRNAALEEAAQKCNGRLGGALQSNDWWEGFKTARRQCVGILNSLKEPTP